MLYYVYILMCKNNKLYVGCSNNLKERIDRHNRGHGKFTRRSLPVKLIFFCCFPNKYLAFSFEKYLKLGSGRAFLKKRLVKT